jgi:Domain of unknown function (DUF4136)
MKHSTLASFILIVLAGGFVAAQTPKYGVTTTADKNADFTKLKTYTWEHGWQSPDKQIHEMIVSAIDRELAAAGLQEKASGPADVLVTYASLRRIDVDLKSKPTDGEAGRRQYEVGSLVVLMLDPASRKELYRARVDQPIDMDREKIQSIVDTAVTEMFAKYPTKAGKK